MYNKQANTKSAAGKPNNFEVMLSNNDTIPRPASMGPKPPTGTGRPNSPSPPPQREVSVRRPITASNQGGLSEKAVSVLVTQLVSDTLSSQLGSLMSNIMQSGDLAKQIKDSVETAVANSIEKLKGTSSSIARGGGVDSDTAEKALAAANKCLAQQKILAARLDSAQPPAGANGQGGGGVEQQIKVIQALSVVQTQQAELEAKASAMDQTVRSLLTKVDQMKQDNGRLIQVVERLQVAQMSGIGDGTFQLSSSSSTYFSDRQKEFEQKVEDATKQLGDFAASLGNEITSTVAVWQTQMQANQKSLEEHAEVMNTVKAIIKEQERSVAKSEEMDQKLGLSDKAVQELTQKTKELQAGLLGIVEQYELSDKTVQELTVRTKELKAGQGGNTAELEKMVAATNKGLQELQLAINELKAGQELHVSKATFADQVKSIVTSEISELATLPKKLQDLQEKVETLISKIAGQLDGKLQEKMTRLDEVMLAMARQIDVIQTHLRQDETFDSAEAKDSKVASTPPVVPASVSKSASVSTAASNKVKKPA